MIAVLALKWLRAGSMRDQPRAETAITSGPPLSNGCGQGKTATSGSALAGRALERWPAAASMLDQGDGTDATPDQNSALLDHLAAYGFTVIAPDQHNTGSGDEIATAARYLIAQAGAAGSVFQGRLDTGKVDSPPWLSHRPKTALFVARSAAQAVGRRPSFRMFSSRVALSPAGG
jgi:hypothetical protein